MGSGQSLPASSLACTQTILQSHCLGKMLVQNLLALEPQVLSAQTLRSDSIPPDCCRLLRSVLLDQLRGDVTTIPKNNKQTGNTKGYRIYQTHVTMAHYSSSTQIEMKTKYSSLENMTIQIYITTFYFSDRIAAF